MSDQRESPGFGRGEEVKVLLRTEREAVAREVRACLVDTPIALLVARGAYGTADAALDVLVLDAGDAPARGGRAQGEDGAALSRRPLTPVVWVLDDAAAWRCISRRLLAGDDFVARPLRAEELRGRILLAAARRPRPPGPVLRVGGLEVDPVRRAVRREGVEIGLSSGEFALLHYLAACHERPVSRDEIIARLWAAAVPGGNAVDAMILRVRRKVGRDRVRTVRGFGYQLVP